MTVGHIHSAKEALIAAGSFLSTALDVRISSRLPL